MPELPEVELVAKSLNKFVSNAKIIAAELRRERLAPDVSPSIFSKKLKGATINFVHRRGKHVLFDLDNRQTLLTHLRMTGRFMLLPLERELPKHSHAIFYFSDDTRLIFQDQRHFGLMRIIETARLSEAKKLCDLAPEPLTDEFSFPYFQKILKSSKRSLKEFLLDQTKVCGLGNIYASEALHLAQVNPKLNAEKLSKPKAIILLQRIKEVLSVAIEHSSIADVNPENIDGSYFDGANEGKWLVYGRENEDCKSCGSIIKRIVQGGRSTFYCPACQKK